MLINLRIASCLLLAGLSGVQAQQADEIERALNDLSPVGQLEPYVDGIVQAMQQEHHLPGLIVAVTGRAQDRLTKGYGQADAAGNRPVDASTTLFRIGSISKTFTWTAVMMLVDRGQLDLNADVNDYLTEFQIQNAFNAPVTLADLMAHRAGFEDTLQVFQPNDDDPRSLAETLAQTQPARVFPPGTRTSYSNWGSALAAHIVEAVDGRPYIDFLNQEILEPLQMRSTTLVQPSQLEADWAERMSQVLRRSGGRFELGDQMQIGPFAPAGGIASTASDMARWMRFHLGNGALDGVRLMSEATHARMLTRQFEDRLGAADLAHGFQNYPLHGANVFGHGGSTGNFQSLMLFVPELAFGVFASQNSGSGGYATVNTLTHLLIEREIEASGGSIEIEFDATGNQADLSEFSGSYRNNRRSFETFTAAFAIEPTISVQAADDGSLIVQQNGDAARFHPKAEFDDVFINDSGQTLQFQRDQDGTVVALNEGSGVHSHERVSTRGMPWALIVPILLVLALTITTLLGFWKRWRQQKETTTAGRRAARRALIAAVGMLVYSGLAIMTVIAVSSINAGNIGEFPSTALRLFSYAGWALLILAAVMLSGLIPAWRGSGWGILRRLHYTAFALALPVLCAQLWYWNLFGAKLI